MSDIEYVNSDDGILQGRFMDSPEFEQLKDEVVAQLFEINGQVSTLNQFVSSLKSFLRKGDVSAKAIDKIDKKSVDKIGTVTDAITKINDLIQKLNQIDDTTLDTVQIIAREKLNRDVRYSVQEFQNTQMSFTDVMKSINEKARESLHLDENNTALLQEEEGERSGPFKTTEGQTQISHSKMVVERDPINNEEFIYQQNLIQQRDEEILNIQSGISDLNEIFKDLDNVVQQQGIMVDNIEANIYSTADNTNLASRELSKAMRYQKRSGKYCLYLLIVLSVMLLFILLITFI